jgi:hypothetical protein
MGNRVNRNLDGSPRQGRRRECERRLRQQMRAQVGREEDRRLVEALTTLPTETLTALLSLDDAEAGYVEQAIADADARVQGSGEARTAVEPAAGPVLRPLQPISDALVEAASIPMPDPLVLPEETRAYARAILKAARTEAAR